MFVTDRWGPHMLSRGQALNTVLMRGPMSRTGLQQCMMTHADMGWSLTSAIADAEIAARVSRELGTSLEANPVDFDMSPGETVVFVQLREDALAYWLFGWQSSMTIEEIASEL